MEAPVGVIISSGRVLTAVFLPSAPQLPCYGPLSCRWVRVACRSARGLFWCSLHCGLPVTPSYSRFRALSLERFVSANITAFRRQIALNSINRRFRTRPDRTQSAAVLNPRRFYSQL